MIMASARNKNMGAKTTIDHVTPLLRVNVVYSFPVLIRWLPPLS
jgi:hypothetical protein